MKHSHYKGMELPDTTSKDIDGNPIFSQYSELLVKVKILDDKLVDFLKKYQYWKVFLPIHGAFFCGLYNIDIQDNIFTFTNLESKRTYAHDVLFLLNTWIRFLSPYANVEGDPEVYVSVSCEKVYEDTCFPGKFFRLTYPVNEPIRIKEYYHILAMKFFYDLELKNSNELEITDVNRVSSILSSFHNKYFKFLDIIRNYLYSHKKILECCLYQEELEKLEYMKTYVEKVISEKVPKPLEKINIYGMFEYPFEYIVFTSFSDFMLE